MRTVGWALALGGCAPPDAGSWTWIGPEGGVLDVGPFTIEIPEGALPLGESIHVEDSGERPPAPFAGVSTVWRVGPAIELERPARLVFEGVGEGMAELHVAGPGGWTWVAGPRIGSLDAEIDRLGDLFAAEPRPPEVELEVHFPPVDVLFVVDDSVQLGEEGGRLPVAGFTVLPDLFATGLDVHVGLTRARMGDDPGEGGRLVRRDGRSFLDSNDLDGGESGRAFFDLASPRSEGTDGGEGRAAMRAAVESEYAGDVGFWRPDGTLAAVFVSDRDDRSGGPGQAAFLTWAAGLRDRPEDVVLHAVAWLPDRGCPTGSLPSDAYPAYAAATGGLTHHVCRADWTDALGAMMDRALDTGRVRVPDAGEDGPGLVLLPAAGGEIPLDAGAFTWDVTRRTAYFDRGVRPAPGDRVRARVRPETP